MTKSAVFITSWQNVFSLPFHQGLRSIYSLYFNIFLSDYCVNIQHLSLIICFQVCDPQKIPLILVHLYIGSL